MTPPTAPERCPTCDRDGLNCPTLETLVRGTLPQTEVRSIAIAAMQDCHAHRVDWRARAIAAESAAAQWAKVAPLIERLRAEVGSRDVYRSPYDLIDAVHFLLAATEATP